MKRLLNPSHQLLMVLLMVLVSQKIRKMNNYKNTQSNFIWLGILFAISRLECYSNKVIKFLILICFSRRTLSANYLKLQKNW